jgi:hypothetical protein
VRDHRARAEQRSSREAEDEQVRAVCDALEREALEVRPVVREHERRLHVRSVAAVVEGGHPSGLRAGSGRDGKERTARERELGRGGGTTARATAGGDGHRASVISRPTSPRMR